MNTYTAIIVKQYSEGRICITTDRIGKYLSTYGGSSSLWRKLLQWTGQRNSIETINIGIINSSNVYYIREMEKLSPISFQEISTNDILNKDISKYDMLYFIGLPESENISEAIEKYVRQGGGVYIEVPDKEGEIKILKDIDSIVCSSVNRPVLDSAYWTQEGQNHYIYTSDVAVGFLTTMNMSSFPSDWYSLMSNIPYVVSTFNNSMPETKYKDGSEFAVGYSIAMKYGIVKIEQI